MFKLYKSEEIESIGKGYVYKHSCGCTLVYIENEDTDRVFTIGFNTLPDNDKGIPHIVEHCVLCGSDKYRVKDPFNILDKGSIHTYLNAMTYRDKTVFPIGSTNEEDFKTLMRVYCDAVFNPLMYNEEGIFRQEGWNSDGNEYSGIVLNEMKGVYSDPAVVLSELINKKMFEGCGYAYDAGGNPENIIELSYEEFIDFHREHYHPSNAVIYIYGKININEYLNILDNEFLDKYEYREKKPAAKAVVNDGVNVELKYGSTGKNILTAVFNTGESSDVEKCTMLGILSSLWCYTEGGNIKEAVLDAGLGDKISCAFDDSGISSVMEITVENSNEKDINKFKSVLNDVFDDIAENGVDEYKLKGVINSVKFFFKEEDFGYKPKGLFYGLLVLNSFLKGRENFNSIKINNIFKNIEKIDVRDIVKKYFINKGSYGILIADNELKKEEKLVCEKNNESLIRYQSREDSPEEIKKLMTANVSDISREVFKVKYDNDGENVFVPLDDGDIVYIDIYFDISKFENPLAVNGYRAIADIYDEELSNDIDYYTGGFSTNVTALKKSKEYRPVLLFKIKCLKENIEKSLEIFERLIFQKYENKDRIYRIISETKQNIRNSYIEAGNTKAVSEALSQVSAASAWENKAKGTDFYSYINSNMIAEDISSVKSIFKRGNAFYAAAGGREDKEFIISVIEKTLSALEKGGEKHILSDGVLSQSKGIVVDGNVNFNAAAFEMNCSSGISRVVQQIISREYVWDKIRLEGGAYGGGCTFGKTFSYMYSYRDPNVEKTFNVFREAGKYLAESKYSQSDIDRFIIGTINEIDRPVKKHSLTGIAMRKAFNDENKEAAVKRREQILNAVPRDINEFGQRLMNIEIKGLCSVGKENDIKNCGIFKEIYSID